MPLTCLHCPHSKEDYKANAKSLTPVNGVSIAGMRASRSPPEIDTMTTSDKIDDCMLSRQNCMQNSHRKSIQTLHTPFKDTPTGIVRTLGMHFLSHTYTCTLKPCLHNRLFGRLRQCNLQAFEIVHTRNV